MQRVSFTTEPQFSLVNDEKAMCFKNYEEPACSPPLPLSRQRRVKNKWPILELRKLGSYDTSGINSYITAFPTLLFPLNSPIWGAKVDYKMKNESVWRTDVLFGLFRNRR